MIKGNYDKAFDPEPPKEPPGSKKNIDRVFMESRKKIEELFFCFMKKLEHSKKELQKRKNRIDNELIVTRDFIDRLQIKESNLLGG